MDFILGFAVAAALAVAIAYFWPSKAKDYVDEVQKLDDK